jgi:spoIIIJ-associated protein
MNPGAAEGAVTPEEAREALLELLEEVTESLGLEGQISVTEGDGVLVGRVEGEELGLFIGRRGQTIDAVQHLAQRIVFRGTPSDTRIVIDADDYRERREAALGEEADNAAERAVRSDRAVALDPMPASERRIVHEYVRERGDVETYSEGEEPERYVVIAPRQS